jgi:hypothetical protein
MNRDLSRSLFRVFDLHRIPCWTFYGDGPVPKDLQTLHKPVAGRTGYRLVAIPRLPFRSNRNNFLA